MIKFFWVITLLCAILAGLVLGFTVLAAAGAPQQAAGAAIALGLAVIPYIATRAIQELEK